MRNIGDFVDSVRTEVQIEVFRVPVGTVLVITPWNFPVALPAWKIAPALAFGNSVILKPASTTPASACALAKIIHEAGVPEAVFQMLLSDSVLGETLVKNPAFDAVSFRGSFAVGRNIARLSGELLRHFQLEMGSKNALIILDDADIDIAVACAINGAFGGTGQKCTASSRIIVSEGIYKTFLEKFTEAASQFRLFGRYVRTKPISFSS